MCPLFRDFRRFGGAGEEHRFFAGKLCERGGFFPIKWGIFPEKKEADAAAL